MSTVAAQSASWVRRFHKSAAETVLVCFPHAGGAASYFFPVSRQLSPQLDVLAIQYPGRQERRHEPCIQDIATLADRVADALSPQLESAGKPVMFFGHSMGAVVAFEVTRRLEAGGVSPSALFASGRRAPSCYRHETLHREGDMALIAEVRRLGGTDPQALDDPELLSMVLPAIRGDYTAILSYRCPPGRTINAPVFALVGDADPHVTVDEAALWREHTSAAFELSVFPGGHFYLNKHAPAVMQKIVEKIPVQS